MLAFLPDKRIVLAAMIQVLPLSPAGENDRFPLVTCVVHLLQGA